MDNRPIYLVVTQHFPSPECWRGSFVYDFVRALMRTEQYDVRVLVPSRSKDYEIDGVKVVCFSRVALRSAIFPFLFAPLNQRIFLKTLQRIGVDVTRVAVCHAHGVFLGDYAVALKKVAPQVLSLLHHHDKSSFGLRLGILRHFWPHQALLYRQLLKLHAALDAHVFISKTVRDSFLETPTPRDCFCSDYRRCLRGFAHFPSPKIKRAIILPNGVDGDLFYPTKSAQPHPLTIGCVGNFFECKGQMVLLQALEQIQDHLPHGWKLRFIGTGPYREACEQFVLDRKLTQHVTFESERHHAELPDFLRSLDLFALPSFFEGFGCVYQEASACGIPFLACKGQGIADILPNGAPELVDPNHVGALAEKILQFIHAPWPARKPILIDQSVADFLKELA